jgi:hypothetical protein
MTPVSLRAAGLARAFAWLGMRPRPSVARDAGPEWPAHEQLREARERRHHVAAATHFLAVGGRIDIVRVPR